MARNDESQRGAGAPSRVYKSSDVHKRRVDRKGREKRVEKAPEPERAIAPAQPPLPDDASPTAPDAASETGRNAVVITPEFGRKTDAQREADDRWFAAMRENDLPARRLDIPEVNPKPVDDRQTIPSSAQRTRDVSAAALAQEPAGAASPPVEDAPAASPSEPPMPQREEGRPTAGIEPPVNHASETAPTARFGAGAAGAFAAR